jgi:hypothetical protein
MSSRTVRISPQTHAKLKELAEQAGLPMPAVLERAVDEYERRKFLEGLNEDFARLRSDPKAWADELAERALFEGTLMDDLEDD